MTIKLEKINYRYHNLEFRTVDVNLIRNGALTTAEISEWAVDDSHRWVIAYWEYTGEAWDLRFVGNRFLSVDKDHLFEVMMFGQKYLERIGDEL